MIKEKQIIHENGNYWVLKKGPIFYTMKTGVTCSESLCAFDKPCLAIAYCDYNARRAHGVTA